MRGGEEEQKKTSMVWKKGCTKGVIRFKLRYQWGHSVKVSTCPKDVESFGHVFEQWPSAEGEEESNHVKDLTPSARTQF